MVFWKGKGTYTTLIFGKQFNILPLPSHSPRKKPRAEMIGLGPVTGGLFPPPHPEDKECAKTKVGQPERGGGGE